MKSNRKCNNDIIGLMILSIFRIIKDAQVIIHVLWIGVNPYTCLCEVNFAEVIT